MSLSIKSHFWQPHFLLLQVAKVTSAFCRTHFSGWRHMTQFAFYKYTSMSIHPSTKSMYPILLLFWHLEQMPLSLPELPLEHFVCKNAFLTLPFLQPASPDSLTINTEETERHHPLHRVIQVHLAAQQSVFYCPGTHSKCQRKPIGCSWPFLSRWETHSAAHHISIWNHTLGCLKHR